MPTLNDVYEDWRSRPFPDGSANDEIDDLHADLALADTWVADSVVPFIERGISRPARLPVVDELHKMRTRATEIRRRLGGADAALLATYEEYVELLAAVYSAFLNATATREE